MSATPAERPLKLRSASTELMRRFGRSSILRQAAVYALGSGAAMMLSGAGQAIIARELSPSAFGSFSFAVSLVTLIAVLFDFGLFPSSSRRLARSELGERSEILGAALVAFIPLAALISVAMFGLSFITDSIFHVHAGEALRVGSVFAWAWSFPLMGERLSKGTGRLHVFSISNLLGSVGMVAGLLLFVVAGVPFTVVSTFLVVTISWVASLIVFCVWLRPRVRRLRSHLRDFVADTRAWALQMYIGRVFSIGTYNMDVLMVAAFSDAKSTGYYSLASAIAGFMGLPMWGLSAALFPRMAREDRIAGTWILTAWAIGGACLLVALFIVPPLLVLVFSNSYSPVAALTVPLVMAGAIRGVTSLYNTFMSAHARGREMRNVGFTLTGSNLVFNFALIPPFGATGAAWASLLALLVNYGAYFTTYRRYVSGPAAAETLSAPGSTG